MATIQLTPDMPEHKTFRGKPPSPPMFENKLEEREFLKFRLAQALRIFGNHGYEEGVAGHITVRDPVQPNCFWVNPFVNHLRGHGCTLRMLNTAAFMIHAAIHAARPDVLCAAHSHSTYGKAFSALGKSLDPISQDACAFYNDHALYTQYNGIVLDKAEGKAIAEAPGDVSLLIALERACQVQILADTAAAAQGGKTVKPSSQQAEETWRLVGSERAGWFSGSLEFAVLEREEGVKFSGSSG
ncbi:class II aldolase/adducin domain-containing protein [Mycena metata]|uniref:Class II aldolase/adducin domain-containing protein n=1 Tax=Mycena metata TaxID=1033252 RepID=A0AAD7GM94_9AGAR|nr:class II aldolase/adducin domain-containing protein [Mycena metata]